MRSFLGAAASAVLLICAAAPGQTVPEPGQLSRELAGTDANARRRAVEALGDLRTPEAVRLLTEAYRAEKVDAAGVKAAAATALGRIGLPESAGPLAEMLSDPDYWVRRKAAEALARVPGEAAAAALSTAAGDGDPRVRAAAVASLAARGTASGALSRALEDADPRVVVAALEGLGGSAQERAAVELALASGEPLVRCRGAYLLARSGDARGLAALGEELRGSGRGPAVRELARLGGSGIRVLIEALGDPAVSDREPIVAALERQSSPESTEFFCQLAGRAGAPAELRTRAASVLFDRAAALTPEQVRAAAALLFEADRDLVAIALQILLERGSAAELPSIVSLARDENPTIRHFALANVAKFGGAEHEALFVTALSDRNGGVVRLALEALGRLGGAGSVAAIRSLEQDRLLRRYAEAAREAIEARQ